MEKILVIDDSPVQANLLKSILEDTYDVTTVHNAEGGLAYAASGEFSLILLDVIMPSINGFEVLTLLQDGVATRHIPVILITSLSDYQNEEKGLTLGAVDYISKPFHPLVVKARVNTHIKLYQYRTQIQQQATLDQLTGIVNRRYYNTASLEKWQDAVRLGVPISIAMMDIDKFKVYNDTLGHPAGDEVIAAVAKAAAGCFQRSTDLFARYGGEEFVAVLLGGSARDAYNHMKRVRQAVEDLHIPHDKNVAPWVTISIGGVTLVPTPRDAYATHLKIADTMLYDAKRFGRNQVVWSNEKMEQKREKPASAGK